VILLEIKDNNRLGKGTKKNKDICPSVPFKHLSYKLTPFDIKNEKKKELKLQIHQLESIIVRVRKETTNFGKCSHFSKCRKAG
jgi:hypothetical protein